MSGILVKPPLEVAVELVTRLPSEAVTLIDRSI